MIEDAAFIENIDPRDVLERSLENEQLALGLFVRHNVRYGSRRRVDGEPTCSEGLYTMKLAAKKRAKIIAPQVCVDAVRGIRRALAELSKASEKRITRRIFHAARVTPAYLGAGALEGLQNAYPKQTSYRYAPEAVEARGRRRAAEILALPQGRRAENFLELGCWDGMISWGFAREGKRATAIDMTAAGFDRRAIEAGVRFVRADAGNMPFRDGEFDFIVSFNTFEHLSDPGNVLQEAIRVVRVGGFILLDFGPLYYAAYGEHAYRSIRVPYCQFLWPGEVLNAFCERKGLEPIDFDHVNRWSLERYRELWDRHSEVLAKVIYEEHEDLAHLSLIRRFPSCFKSKSTCFENFTVTRIRALFQKTD